MSTDRCSELCRELGSSARQVFYLWAETLQWQWLQLQWQWLQWYCCWWSGASFTILNNKIKYKAVKDNNNNKSVNHGQACEWQWSMWSSLKGHQGEGVEGQNKLLPRPQPSLQLLYPQRDFSKNCWNQTNTAHHCPRLVYHHHPTLAKIAYSLRMWPASSIHLNFLLLHWLLCLWLNKGLMMKLLVQLSSSWG